MRKLETGNEGSVAEVLTVYAVDEPGPGGACHEYLIEVDGPSANGPIETRIKFQKGAIHEAGINGITNEALLAIVIDRLEGFARGPFSDPHTQLALSYARSVVEALEARTRERIDRGVEGTHQK